MCILGNVHVMTYFLFLELSLLLNFFPLLYIFFPIIVCTYCAFQNSFAYNQQIKMYFNSKPCVLFTFTILYGGPQTDIDILKNLFLLFSLYKVIFQYDQSKKVL